MKIRDVSKMPLNLVAVLGVADTTVADVFKLEPDQVIELRQLTEEPIELRTDGGRLVAHGQMAVVGSRRAIQVTRVVTVDRRLGWRRYE